MVLGVAVLQTQKNQSIGRLTYFCDLLALVLTLVYSAIVISDVVRGGAHLTSSEWYTEGFCVWRGTGGLTSHALCTRADLPLGLLTAVVNVVNLRKQGETIDPKMRVGLRLAIASSVFNILHGLGHHEIEVNGGDLQAVHPSELSWPLFARAYAGVFCFLGLGPFLGNLFGIPVLPCLLVHAPTSLAFLYLPPQLAFGAVQLVINCWYCVPRLLWIGWEKDEDLHMRVENGWAVSSVGNLLLMAVVFSEAFACEAFYKQSGGHFLYDFSILLITMANCAVLWRQGSKATPAAAKKVE